MKKQLLFAVAIFTAMALQAQIKDPGVYPMVQNYKLESLWIQSRNTSNYPAIGYGVSGGAATTADARSMAGKDGKILFCYREADVSGTNRTLERYVRRTKVLIYNGLTGELERTIALPDSLFHQKDATSDTIRAIGYPANDIQVDAAGNIVLMGMTTNLGVTPLIVYGLKFDLATGTVLQVKRLLKESYAVAVGARIDAFNVYGDLFNNGYFMAAISGSSAGLSNFVYKWDVANGVTNIEYKEIEIKRYVPIATKFNDTAPRVKPITETLFYLDGQASYPTLYDMSGTVIDTIAKANWPASPGNNGVDEFVLGGKNFVVYSNANTAVAPKSSWAVAELGPGQNLSTMTKLFVFPAEGMGSTSNGVRTAVPYIDVIGDVAYIYVYGFNNGLAAYKFSISPASVTNPNTSSVEINVVNKQIKFSETVAKADIFSVTGQKFAAEKNVTQFSNLLNNGVYIVSLTDKAGKSKIQKVIIN
jgi:hypothetical protein